MDLPSGSVRKTRLTPSNICRPTPNPLFLMLSPRLFYLNMFCSLSLKTSIRNERPWVASKCRRREGRSSIFTSLPTSIQKSNLLLSVPIYPPPRIMGRGGAWMTGNYKSARGPSTAALFERPVTNSRFFHPSTTRYPFPTTRAAAYEGLPLRLYLGNPFTNNYVIYLRSYTVSQKNWDPWHFRV